MLVEKHSGMTFPEFTKKFIFDPLQMTSTQFSRPTDGSACELYTVYTNNGYTHKTNPGGYCYPDYPSGQLWSTPSDLAKFSLAMLKRGNLGYTTSDGADCLYSQVTGDLVFEKSSPSTGDGDSALGWFVGRPYYDGGAGHNGGETGVSSDFFVNLEKNVAFGYWANGELTINQSDQIFEKLLETAIAIGAIDNEYSSNNPKECSTTFSTDGSPTQPSSTPPTATPVASPVTAPSSSSCADSTIRFRVSINGRNRFRGCSWVETNTNRCNKPGVSALCPSTCGTCSICEDSSTRFKVMINGRPRSRDCGWANNWRCSKFDKVDEACKNKCGTCDAEVVDDDE
jgi:hypothetical protein